MEYKNHWYFGDGSESTELEPLHTFKMAGEYEVLRIRTYDSGIVIRNTLVVYVYEWGIELHVVYSNRCIRDAVVPMQGIGMCEWGGDNWVWPEAYVGSANGLNKSNQTISIVLDTYSGLHFRIGQKDQWLDKLDNLGYVKGFGYEIPTWWKLKEYVASSGEYKDVRHAETHAYFRPFWETDRSKEGHNPENGYRNAFAVTARMFKDGNLEFETETQNIPLLGDITYPKEIQGPRFQTEFRTSTSSFRCIGVQEQVEEIDKKRGPVYNTKQETLWGREFSRPDFWVSRSSTTPLINRATARIVQGSFDTLITGPDNIPQSGLLFGASDGLGINLNLLGESSLLFWVSEITENTTIFQFATQRISLEWMGESYSLMINNGAMEIEIPIQYNGSGWMFLAIKLLGNMIRVIRNKEDFGLRPLTFGNYGGDTTIMNNISGGLFDVRRVPRNISLEALEYYYDVVTKNNGSTGFLPVMK